MAKVIELLSAKGAQVWSVSPDTTLEEAIAEMVSKGIGALPVLHNNKLVGIISERDCARQGILRDHPKKTPVSELMSTPVLTIRPDITDEQCLSLMTEKRLRHLPVIEDGKMVGMISIGDVVKSIISHQQEVIEHLEHVISWEEGY